MAKMRVLFIVLLAFIATPIKAQRCAYSQGDYSLKWWKDGERIVFDLKYDNFGNNGWTGVAFGGNRMSNVDWIEVKIR